MKIYEYKRSMPFFDLRPYLFRQGDRKKYVKNRSGHMTSMATMPVYGKNLLGHEPDMVYLPLQGGV